MILDAQNLLSDAQALTATAVSDNAIDLGNVTPKRDIGAGEPMCLMFQVDVAADFTTGNETYQFDLIQSANANLSSSTTLESRIIAASLLTAGSIHYVPIPPGAVTARYLGANYTLGGTTPTLTVTCALMPQKDTVSLQTYAKGYAIS